MNILEAEPATQVQHSFQTRGFGGLNLDLELELKNLKLLVISNIIQLLIMANCLLIKDMYIPGKSSYTCCVTCVCHHYPTEWYSYSGEA